MLQNVLKSKDKYDLNKGIGFYKRKSESQLTKFGSAFLSEINCCTRRTNEGIIEGESIRSQKAVKLSNITNTLVSFSSICSSIL